MSPINHQEFNWNSVVKVGLVCGDGDLPQVIKAKLHSKNIEVIVAAIKGFAKPSLLSTKADFGVGLGEMGKIGTRFAEAGVTHMCFAGGVKRPSLWRIRPDKYTRGLLYKYLEHIRGDNSLLELIVESYERDFGFKVVGAHVLCPEILSHLNFKSDLAPTPENWKDIRLGFKAAKTLGALDIGQSVVVQHQVVIAVEGVEGTKLLLKRSKKLLKKAGTKGVLVKVKKDQQDNRIDLPTVGLKTLKQCHKAGLAGLVIEAGASLVLNQAELLEYAKKNNMFVLCADEESLVKG